MNSNEPITLTRDVEGTVIPTGTKVTLQKGEQAFITQSLGGTYTVIVKGNMFASRPRTPTRSASKWPPRPFRRPPSTARKSRRKRGTRCGPATTRKSRSTSWNWAWFTINVEPLGAPDRYKMGVKITLTAPGCGMGPALRQDVQNKLLSIETVDEATVEVVWDPQWNQGMMSEAAKLQLGLM